MSMQQTLFGDSKQPIAVDNLISLRGVLKRVLFANKDNGYTVGQFYLSENQDTITITGSFPSVQCGETLIVRGEWIEHPQYGKQFKCLQFESQLPSDVHGIRQYLSSGLIHGIGKTYANKIVEFFGVNTFKILNEAYARLLDIPGIGPKRAKSIKAAWDEQQAIRELMIFLQTYGFTSTQCLRLYKRYGEKTKSVILENPYIIAQTIDGIGFKSADKIALNFGFANDSNFRIDAGIEFQLLEFEKSGHTGANKALLLDKTAELLCVEPSLIESRIENLLAEDRLSFHEKSNLIQRQQMAFAEQNIASNVIRLKKSKSCLQNIHTEDVITKACDKMQIVLSEKQRNALFGILNSKLSVLTGGPGTGKTTILKALVDILAEKKLRICLAAPTGRAAQRMSETTGIQAKTIHRTLKYEPSIGRFTFDEYNMLPVDVLIVDEASMIDVPLANALFKAIPNKANVLLVGDVFQLPSVGPGNVLNDLITGELFEVQRLTEIFRQGARSSIVTTAHNILNGIAKLTTPIYSPNDEPNLNEDFHFIEAQEPAECVAAINKLCWELIPKWYKKNPISDIQILAPMHKGIAGIENINTLFQQKMGPYRKKIQIGGQMFFVGDKVIQTKNNYDKNIFNGDLGLIVDIDEEESQIIVQFDSETHSLDRAECLDLKIAYAISIHKSQGSEFPIVIIPLLKQHFVMLKRNLIYTGITRGKQKVFVVGDFKAYYLATKTEDSSVRQTTLATK